MVAFDAESATDLLKPHIENETLLVRKDVVTEGHEEARYISVTYEYTSDDAPLPSQMFENIGQWRFALKRDPGRDASLKETYIRVRDDQTGRELERRSRYRRLPGFEKEHLP